MAIFKYNKSVTLEENISFIEELLNKFLPIDYANVEKEYPYEWLIKMHPRFKGLSPDEVKKLKLADLDVIKKDFEKSLKKLKARRK